MYVYIYIYIYIVYIICIYIYIYIYILYNSITHSCGRCFHQVVFPTQQAPGLPQIDTFLNPPTSV